MFFVAASPKLKSGSKRKSTQSIGSDAKKKRISFGPSLSPEMFDKKLPPITPVRKGTTPRRLSEPFSVLSPKSLLKRKSLANFRKESTITEESPSKESPVKSAKSTPARKSPKTPNRKSPAKSPKSTPVTTKSPRTSPAKGKSPQSPKSRKNSPATGRKTNKRLSTSLSEEKLNADISYTGIEELMKTPTVATSTPKAGKESSGQRRRASTGALNLTGVKRLMKTPKNKLDEVSFTGLSVIMKTPEAEVQAVKKVTPKSSTRKSIQGKRNPSPKSAKKATPAKRVSTPRKISPKSLKKTPKSLKKSPPSTIRNAVAMRAIHGKQKTPKLPTNLWSDIVKKGIADTGVARRRSAKKPLPVVQKRNKTPKSIKKVFLN